MDLASKLKLLRHGVRRNDAQLIGLKKQVSKSAAKTARQKEGQKKAVVIHDKIKEQIKALEHFIRIGGEDRSEDDMIRILWEGSMGEPGLSDMVEEHGRLNGYDAEDIQEHMEEIENHLEEYYESFYGRR